MERDGRTLNHMDPATRVVHARLEEWGRWVYTQQPRAWAPITVLGRVMEQGITGAGQATAPVTDMPPRVEEVERAVLRLEPPDRELVTKYYTHFGPPEVLARHLRTTRRQLSFRLRILRYSLMAWLTAETSTSHRQEPHSPRP